MAAPTTFDDAAKAVQNLKTKPGNDELLQLYGLFKIASGEDIANAKAPGMFDLAGKAKKNAWQALVDEGVDKEAAEKKYIELVVQLQDKYGVKDA